MSRECLRDGQLVWRELEKNHERRRVKGKAVDPENYVDALRFPFRRHQVIPLAAQRLPDSRHRGNQDVDFARFYSANSSSIDVRQLSQTLLGHFQRGANAPDMVSHFPKFGRQLDDFGHTTLAEIFGVDIKGVLRPNLKRVWEPLAEFGR